MQEKYVSLDPNYVSLRQSFNDREIVYEQRYLEARGGNYAQQMGLLLGLSTSTYFYHRA